MPADPPRPLPAETLPVGGETWPPTEAAEATPPPAGARYLPGPPDTPVEAPRELGHGAYGAVLLVWDVVLGREVALKQLHPHHAAGASAARFVEEARLSARLEHPGIVPVHDLGRRDDGLPFYTMKVVRGRTLATAITEAGTPAARLELLDAFVDLCQAVAYAHSRGVVHRDLKPANVMVGSFGETLLIDWGVAVDRLAPAPVPGASDWVGSPAWMSPEAARRERVDERSDVYGLGAILYTLLTGRAPHPGNAEEALAHARHHPAPSAAGPGVPPPLVSIAARAMAADPDQRHPDPMALAAEIRGWRSGDRVPSHRYRPVELLGRALVRHGGKLLVGVVGLALLLAGVLVSQARTAAERDRAVRAEEEARTNAATAEELLVQSLVGRAVDALEADSVVEASVFAGEALAIREDPRARGALVAADAGLFGALDGARRLAGPARAVAWSGVGGLAVLEDDRVERFDDQLRPLPSLTGVPPVMTGTVLAWSPDGTRLALAGRGGVSVYAPLRGPTPERVLPTEVSPLSVAWIDDHHLVAADQAGAMGVWDVDAGARKRAWTRQHILRAAAATADGRRVVTGANDHSLHAWDPWTLHEPVVLEDDGVGAYQVAISPDGRQVAAVGEVSGGDGRLRLWDLETGRLLARLEGHRGEVAGVRFSPDGRFIGTAGVDATLRLWARDPTGAELPAAVGVLRVRALRLPRFDFSPDAGRVAVAGDDGELRVWRLGARGAASPPVALPRAAVDVSWSPDGRRVLVAGEDSSLRVLDVARGVLGESRRWPGTGGFSATWLSADQLLLHRPGESPWLVDARTGARLRPVGRPSAESTFRFGRCTSPDGRWLWNASLSGDAALTRLDLPDAPSTAVPGEELGSDCAWLPDSSGLYTFGVAHGLYRVDVAGPHVTSLGDFPAALGGVALSPDAHTLAVSDDHRVFLVDPATGGVTRVLAVETRPTPNLAWALGGGVLLAADWRGTIRAWTADSGELIARWQAHSNRIWRLAVSPDGRAAATASGDHRAQVWSLAALVEDRAALVDRVRTATGFVVRDGQLTPRPLSAAEAR